MDEFILNILESAPQLGIATIAMFLMFKMYNRSLDVTKENSQLMGEILEAMRHINGTS
jgi:hypothetical protein